jgi:hypothetical protein
MKARTLSSLSAIMLFAALAAPTRLTAQEQPGSQANPVLLINQPLVPDAFMPVGKGFTLTVKGTGFVSESVVNWNGGARATGFVNGSQLKASILASDVANLSTASVTVVNPAPGGGTSNLGFFEVTIPANPTSPLSLATSDFTVGVGPFDAAIADFNRDGKLDLAVANVWSGYVSVLLGNGDGTFQSAVNYSIGSPVSMAVGDFNRDGKLDLVVGNSFDNSFSVLLGNGDGTFQSATSFGLEGLPEGLAVGGFNGDGNLDVAVAIASTNHLASRFETGK